MRGESGELKSNIQLSSDFASSRFSNKTHFYEKLKRQTGLFSVSNFVDIEGDI
jgi:hypothetical protein